MIHFAGMMYANNLKEICEMINVNIAGLIKVCAAAKHYRTKQIIYISSINATLFEKSLYYGYYSLTKKQGEELAALYCKKEGLRLCIIRPSQIFGPDPAYGKVQPLLYLMIKSALGNKPITIYGNKDVLRNYRDSRVESCRTLEIDDVRIICIWDGKSCYNLQEFGNWVCPVFDH